MTIGPFCCPRCGDQFPGEDDPDAGAEWLSVRHPDGRLEVICPGCATPLDRQYDER
jgi:hypothetical protein